MHTKSLRSFCRPRRGLRIALLAAVSVGFGPLPASADPSSLVYATEGNRLRRVDVDTIGADPQVEDVLIDRASASETGGVAVGDFRDVNGMVCAIPDGSGRLIMGEDTGQPSPPAGWGVFSPAGEQIGKLTATYYARQPEPFGCAFDATGNLFTTSVGDPGFTAKNGQLILWFPPFDRFPGPPGAYPATDASSANFCKIATDIGTATGVAVDREGRVYVSGSSDLSVHRFSPPFPTSPDAAGGCGATDALGSPMADSVQREIFAGTNTVGTLSTFTGLALSRNGNLYAASVVTGEIYELSLAGQLVRRILDPPGDFPPHATGTPQGIAVAADGSVYYADLDLVGEFPDLGPGPNGKVWRIRFDENDEPLAPEIVRDGLAFPDGVAVLPGELEPQEWRSYAGGNSRRFFNPAEASITAANVSALQEKWRFPTDAVITGSPSVARVPVPGEGRIAIAYIQSWDANVYAVRIRDGSELWRFATDDRPGVSYPNTGSVHVERVLGEERVFVGAGQTFYALDAITGAEIWRFDAGTGCLDPPGLCDFDGERNEIESSPLVADGTVFFGMDVNDRTGGKGGFYALDAGDGRLAWFFDLESGAVCRPDPADEIRRFDGYHGEDELGLPPGFLASRTGCDFPRTPNGCGNVWSSPALDAGRGLLFFASSNCETDALPETLEPPPPMPPYDEAIVALHIDGTPAWRWRPREVDNADLAFGAVPNLFEIVRGGALRAVVGVGNKDGAYYVIDREGVNAENGVRFDDPDPSELPYWRTRVVPGGSIGGILATAAVDPLARRVYFGTAPQDVFNPQRPTLHALDADTGAVLWQNTAEANADATFSPTSAIPGVVFTGSILGGFLRAYDATDGTRVARIPIGSALAAAPIVIDGLVVVGGGVGTRTNHPDSEAGRDSQSDTASRIPHDVTALCVPGTRACAVDRPISGKRLRLVDGSSQRKGSLLTLLSDDASIALPAAGGEADPSVVGAELLVIHPFSGRADPIRLPAAGWSAVGDPVRAYLYRDAKRASGPCETVTIEVGEIRASCRGERLGFALDADAQGALATALTLGNATTYCMRFGGTVVQDTPRSGDKFGVFYARNAPAPAHCPLP